MNRFKALFIIICLLTSFSGKKISWVAIGDSITFINNHLDITDSRVTKGYMTRLTEKLPNIQYVNQGYNGWTSEGIAEHFDNLGISKADVYSVFLGTNDWHSGRPLGIFADYINNTGNNSVYGSFRIIINKLRFLNKDAKIILITPMQRTDFVAIANMENNAVGSYQKINNQALSQFAEAVIKISKYEHFDLVNLYGKKDFSLENLVKFKRLRDTLTGQYKNYIYPDYTHIPFDYSKDEYPYPPESIKMTYDGLHPSDRGFEIIAEMLEKIMKKY
jgi:lysophospholipase L1-like esterase